MHCCADMVLSFFERERERERNREEPQYICVCVFRERQGQREGGSGGFFFAHPFLFAQEWPKSRKHARVPGWRRRGRGRGVRSGVSKLRPIGDFWDHQVFVYRILARPPPQTTGALLLLARGRSHVCMRDSKMKMWHGFSPRSKKTSFRRLVDCCFVSAIAPACSSQHSMPRTVGGPGRARSMAFSAAARAVIDIIICEGRGGHCPLSTKQTSGGSSSSVM